MEHARISGYYATQNAVYYRLAEKMDLAPILLRPLNGGGNTGPGHRTLDERGTLAGGLEYKCPLRRIL